MNKVFNLLSTRIEHNLKFNKKDSGTPLKSKESEYLLHMFSFFLNLKKNQLILFIKFQIF